MSKNNFCSSLALSSKLSKTRFVFFKENQTNLGNCRL